MINKKKFLIILISFFAGLLFFTYQKEWIILRFPFKSTNNIDTTITSHAIKKNVRLFYWNNSRWNYEDVEILFSDKSEENIQRIISAWLNIMDEEKIIDKISLQTALTDKLEQEVYLSFDKNLFNEDNSTHQKLMVIEGILKTLRENNIKIPKIYFLIHHQEMMDSHLDFSNFWPIEGFLNK